MIPDRQTAAANLKYKFTPEEDLAYPDLKALLERLRGIHDEDSIKIYFGDDPVNSREDVVRSLLERGQEFAGAKVEKVIMAAQECHSNTIELVRERPHLKRIRGWAVSTCWKGHSWAWDPKENIIYETTGLEWKHYFGSEFSVKA
jgi:hypothetical protein